LALFISRYIKAHHVSHAALSLCAVAAAMVFFAAGAFIRLWLGPISLGPLQQTLAGAIQTALPGITLQYDSAGIEWDREQDRIKLAVLGTRILDADGRVVATAPKADITLAVAPILQGKVAVRGITLVGVSFRLVHMKNGGVRLGAEGDKANDVYQRLSDVIEAKGSASSSLKSFAVRDAHLTLYDEVSGVSLVAPRADLSIRAQGDHLVASLNADVLLTGKPQSEPANARPTHIRADVNLPADVGPISGSATISHLDLAALAADAPLFQPLSALPLTTNLSTRFTIQPGGHVSQTDFDLTAQGDIPFAMLKTKALHVRELRLTGHYDGLHKHLALTQAAMDAREATLRLKGGAEFVYDANHVLDSIVADVASTRATLDLPGVLPQPVTLNALAFKGVWHASQRAFDVQQFALTAQAFDFKAKGGIQLGAPGQSPGLTVNATLAPIDARMLLKYWALPVAPGARDWIDGNIFAGHLGPVTIETHITPGMLDQPIVPDAALTLTFPFTGLEGIYIRGLTHVTGVSGSATLLGDSFNVDFAGGHVGNLVVTKGRGVIPALHVHGTVGDFTAHVDGGLPDIMTLVDMKPLNYATRFGVDPKQTAGNAGVDVDVKVPMLADLNVDAVGIAIKADVQNFGIILGKLRLTNGDVTVAIDNNSLHQSGSVTLADARLNLDWTEDFKTNDAITTRLAVKGQMTDAARAALNIGMADILTGPVGVNAAIQGHRGSLRTADLQLDLTPAAILVPIIHLGKPAGQAATGHVTVNFGANDNVADETVAVTGPNLTANGTVNFDRNGVLTQMNFPTVKLGPLNDLAFAVARAPQGDTYTLRGHSMDASLVGRNGNAAAATASAASGVNATAPDETPSGAFRIDAKLDKVWLREGVAIAPMAMDLTGVGNRPGTLAMTGTLTQTGVKTTGAFTANVEATPQGRKLTMVAGDAGMLIRGMFAFESLRGGKMTLTATLPGRDTDPQVIGPAPDFTGKLDIDNFTMTNQPFLSRLFAAGSLTGIGDLMGSGITISNLDVPFSSKNGVIGISGASASGPAVGMSADGYVDRPKNQVALKGTLVPAYGLNSLVSNVPLLGDILASKKGEGIFGVTYSATGNADQPNINVDPLSALAPGILRRVFQGHIPTAANAPSNAPGNAPPPGKPVIPAPPPASSPGNAQAAAPSPAPRPVQ
jgi:hypothetical protein